MAWFQYGTSCTCCRSLSSIFEHLGRFSKNICATLQLIWLATVWKKCLGLSSKEELIQHFQDKNKLQSYWWLKANRLNFDFNYHLWWLNPFACLEITL